MSAAKRPAPKAQLMFEIGKRYTVTMGQGDDEGMLDYWVAAYEHPLLKLRNPNIPDIVVNVMSPNFVSAELSKHQDGMPKAKR